MSIHGLAAIAVRLTGIAIGLYAVKNGAASIYTIAVAGGDPVSWIGLVPVAMMVVASVCMIVFPALIAGRLLAAETGSLATKPASELDFEALGCTLVGLYFLVHAVMDATYILSYWLASMQLDHPWVWTKHFVAMAVTTVAEFLLAGWLLFRAQGLLGLLAWARGYDPRRYDQTD